MIMANENLTKGSIKRGAKIFGADKKTIIIDKDLIDAKQLISKGNGAIY